MIHLKWQNQRDVLAIQSSSEYWGSLKLFFKWRFGSCLLGHSESLSVQTAAWLFFWAASLLSLYWAANLAI